VCGVPPPPFFVVLLFIPPFCALVTSYRGFGIVIVQITFVVLTAILAITSKLEKDLEVPFKEKKRVDEANVLYKRLCPNS
jgi:energy-converting hydrogenase Eha subunit H